MPKQMHLAQFLMYGPTYHSLAMWRHPRPDARYDWARPELYGHIAQVCERRQVGHGLLCGLRDHFRPLPAVVRAQHPLRRPGAGL